MSNNLMSQELPLTTSQMEPVPNILDPPISNMQMQVVETCSSNPTLEQFVISNQLQQFAMSNQQMGLVDAMSNSLRPYNVTESNRGIGLIESNMGYMGQHQFFIPNQHVGQMGFMLNNPGPQKLLSPNKRKAEVESILSNIEPLQMSFPNKRVVQMERSPNSMGSPHLSTKNKKFVQIQTMGAISGSQNLPASNKKMARNESMSNKSGSQRVQTSKNRSSQMESCTKVQSESSGAVRAKMRENLAAALALVSQNQDKGPSEERNSQNGTENTSGQRKDESQSTETVSIPVVPNAPEKSTDEHSRRSDCADEPIGQGILTEASTNVSMGNSAQTCDYGAPIFPNQDVTFGDNFFVRDDLLQGNGLSWAFDLDMQQLIETKETQASGKPKLEQGYEQSAETKELRSQIETETVQSPQDLALKIEAELFKLFGGVNKKYKERARSLLFNLKDRNNPELRERVMSGEISPEKLCSMSAEELASKELSQWRMAKAEELAQMVVLPETDLDIRRLVKKTHKGEYQVEVEQDDGYAVEVSVGTSLTQNRPRKETVDNTSVEADEKGKEKVAREKSNSGNKDPSGRFTIPNDGADLMQGLIDDELKDSEFLPPIVSLDEFMESLDTEPPFENLSEDARHTTPLDKGKLESGSKIITSDSPSKDLEDNSVDKADKGDVKHKEYKSDKIDAEQKEFKAHKVDVKRKELELNVKAFSSPAKHENSPAGCASPNEYVWQGAIQLNLAAVVKVVGLFISGEKLSTKEWSSSLEIKGRVRLDAFEKFLQELPMSRSRAVMVVHFVLKEGSSESDRSNLTEAVDSYVLDERLGFAEPAPGVEVYFCPPQPKILGLLSKNLSKDLSEAQESTQHNGMFGVVVWRRAHISSSNISPNSSSSHHKQASKKQQHFTTSSRRHQEKDANVNVVNLTSKGHPGSFSRHPINPQLPSDDGDDNEDDDVPPGFGPGAARDEDDLPEFNFSGNSNPSSMSNQSSHNPSRGIRMNSYRTPLSRPADQMRELVLKYGQTGGGSAALPRGNGVGIGIEPWNDDDDDIPEWQPHVPQTPLPHHRQQPLNNLPLLHQMGGQHLVSPAQPHQLPINIAKAPQTAPQPWQQPGGRWVQQPPGQQPGHFMGRPFFEPGT